MVCYIKNVREQVGTKCDMDRPPSIRRKLPRSVVIWCLKLSDNEPDLAAWIGIISKGLIVKSEDYDETLIAHATNLNNQYGKLSTIYNKDIAMVCNTLYDTLYSKYEVTRQKEKESCKQWLEILDPDKKLYNYKKSGSKKGSRSQTRRLLSRVADKLFAKYGDASLNSDFREKNKESILNFENYVYNNFIVGYDASIAFKLFL